MVGPDEGWGRVLKYTGNTLTSGFCSVLLLAVVAHTQSLDQATTGALTLSYICTPPGHFLRTTFLEHIS